MKIMEGANVTEANYQFVVTLGKIFSAALGATHSGVFYHHNISQLLWGYKDIFLEQIQEKSSQLPKQWLESLNISFPQNLNPRIQLQVLSFAFMYTLLSVIFFSIL